MYTNKEDRSSPTILSCTIDAKENRYVLVSSIPGVFLHTDMDYNVHMLLEGTVAEMIVKLDPTIYIKHTWYNKQGKPMLYVQLKKPYMEHYMQHYYSGSCYQSHYRSGDSH